jgi:Bacterial Ig-like domain/Carboxypeptidase regulatory-like domain
MRSVKFLALVMVGAVGLVACPEKTVPPAKEKPVIASFTASPSSVAPEGGSVTLRWVVKDASEVSVDQGVGVVTGDSRTVDVKSSTTFTLSAKNDVGSVTASAAVTLGKDVTRPSVTSSLPANNATGVAVNAGVAVTFSEAMKAESVRLEVSPSVSLGEAVWDAAKMTVRFDPPLDWQSDTAYVVTVNGADVAGNALESTTLSFRTASPATISLTGRVVGSNGQPLTNAPVVLLSDPSRTTSTDASGGFTFDKVRAPYDVAAVNSSGETAHVLVYRGLTRRDPTLAFIDDEFGQYRYAGVYGYVYRGGSDESPREYQCAFESDSVPLGCSLFDQRYAASLYWRGANTLVGTMHLVGWESQDTARSNYVYGKREAVAVGDQNATVGADVAVNAVASGALSGSVAVANGLTVFRRDLNLNFTDDASAALLFDYSNNSSFSYTTPVIDNATLSLSAYAFGNGFERVTASRRNLASNSSGVRLSLPAAPALGLPLNNVNGVNLEKQVFSWVPMSGGGVSAVSFDANGAFRVTFVTENSSLTWPRVTDLNLGSVPAKTSWSWRVTGLSASKVSSLDDFAAPDGLRRYRSSDTVRGDSDLRAFTTN